MTAAVSRGRLLLVPNTLDLGNEAVALDQVLPHAVLQQAAALQHWAVEDARSARAFLKRVNETVALQTPLQSLNIQELPRPRKGSGQAVARSEWSALLAPARAGHDLGLLSEAGLPAVADPGAELVACAHVEALEVVTLAGPSSLLMALAASGLNGQCFAFLGYLPQDPGARVHRIRDSETASRRHAQTQICIETPYRNQVLIKALADALTPTTRLSVSLGLTLTSARTHTDAVAAWRSKLNLPTGFTLDTKVPAVFSWLAD